MKIKVGILSKFGCLFYVLSIVGCETIPSEQPKPLTPTTQTTSKPLENQVSGKKTISLENSDSLQEQTTPSTPSSTKKEQIGQNTPPRSLAVVIQVVEKMVKIARKDWDSETVLNAYYPNSKIESAKEIPGEDKSLKGWHYKAVDGTNIYWSDEFKRNNEITNVIVVELSDNPDIPLKAYYKLQR